MNLSEMSEKDLKAMAYEQIVLLEQTGQNIKIIQQELAKRQGDEVKSNGDSMDSNEMVEKEKKEYVCPTRKA